MILCRNLCIWAKDLAAVYVRCVTGDETGQVIEAEHASDQ